MRFDRSGCPEPRSPSTAASEAVAIKYHPRKIRNLSKLASHGVHQGSTTTTSCKIYKIEKEKNKHWKRRSGCTRLNERKYERIIGRKKSIKYHKLQIDWAITESDCHCEPKRVEDGSVKGTCHSALRRCLILITGQWFDFFRNYWKELQANRKVCRTLKIDF